MRLFYVSSSILLAGVLSACSGIDLNRNYSPAPVYMPPNSAVAPVSNPVDSASGAIASPVTTPSIPASEVNSATAHIATFSTSMSSAKSVPANSSTASGKLDAIYDSSTGLFRWKASWNGLQGAITAVRFHSGDAGRNGPVILTWPGPYGATYEGRATLPAGVASELLAGRWYVNVQTRTHAQGEIRGQLQVVR